MISFIFPTARGLYPGKGNVAMYDLLASCLAEQTFTDVEVICVDKCNPIPRREVEIACRKFLGGVRFIRPRMTPWTQMGAFAPNAARNSALCWARGETVVGVDDMYAFKPHYLERVAELAREGKYTVSKLSQTDNSVAYPQRPNGPFPQDQHGGGIISYSLSAAVAVNGWDERFDGGSGGDCDFFDRLRRSGVDFVTDEDVAVVGHYDGGRVLAHYRCDRLGPELGLRRRNGGLLRANVAWTTEELQTWKTCGREKTPRVCSVCPYGCDYKDAESENVTAIREGYEAEEFFNLAEERAKNVLLTPAAR